MDMPLENTKCPTAVKSNIADMAIFPDKAKSAASYLKNVKDRLIKNTVNKTIRGFILYAFTHLL